MRTNSGASISDNTKHASHFINVTNLGLIVGILVFKEEVELEADARNSRLDS